jgi:peptide/nickel transport system substrate-binding protein
MVTDLPPDSVELIKNDRVQVVSFPRSYEYLIAFNGRSAKFADPRVRRALNIAIDRDAIVRGILKGSGLPATGPLWTKHWAYDPSAGSFPFDLHEASVLLEAAKLPMRASTDSSRPPARLRMTCLIPAQYSILEQIGLEVQRQLSEIGVDLRFDVAPVDVYEERLTNGDFETAMIDLVGGPSLSRASIMWRSPKRDDAHKMFSYENPVTEALFERLRTAPNDAVTRAEVRKLQQAFLDSPPAIFLAWNERARAIRSDFGVNVAMGTDPLTTIWQWGADKSEGKVSNMAAR